MHRTTRSAIAVITVAVAVSYLAEGTTQAHKRYLIKEGVNSCGYCHTVDAGGGARNYRGQYYQMHAESFAAFDDAAAAKAAGVEIGPHAENMPATGPLPAAPMVGAKSALMVSYQKAHTAELAYNKDLKAPELKAAYVTALAAYTHATLTSEDLTPMKRNADAVVLAKHTLALDPKNADATADLKTAQDAITAAAPAPK